MCASPLRPASAFMAPVTAAAPPISHFMSSMPGPGLIEMPPESKQTPLPMSATGALPSLPPFHCITTTFDGLSVKVLLAKRDGDFWLRLEASEDGEAAKEADKIIARTGGWTYKISAYAASNIAKRLENLVEDAKPKS